MKRKKQKSFVPFSIITSSLKKRISSELDRKIKEYIKQLDNYSINNSFNDFMTWLNNAE